MAAAWVDARAAEMREAIEELEHLDQQLTDPQLRWRPAATQWSIGQVIEHLLLTDGPALAPISELVSTGPRRDAPWRPTFIGRLLVKAVDPRTRWKTTAKAGYLPDETPPSDIVRQYIAVRQRLLTLAEQSRHLDVNGIKLKCPIPTPLAYNLGDAFMILTRHTQRHLQQIRRARQHPGFPGV